MKEAIEKIVDDWSESLIVLGDIVSEHSLEKLKERLVKAIQPKKGIDLYATKTKNTPLPA